jgi:hypothetical protein
LEAGAVAVRGVVGQAEARQEQRRVDGGVATGTEAEIERVGVVRVRRVVVGGGGDGRGGGLATGLGEALVDGATDALAVSAQQANGPLPALPPLHPAARASVAAAAKVDAATM